MSQTERRKVARTKRRVSLRFATFSLRLYGVPPAARHFASSAVTIDAG